MSTTQARSRTFGVILTVITVLGVGGAFFVYFNIALNSNAEDRFMQMLSEVGSVSQNIPGSAEAALQGDRDAFQTLQTSRESFERNIRQMVEGEGAWGGATGELKDEVQILATIWSGQVRDAASVVLAAKDSANVANDNLNQVNNDMPELLAQLDGILNTLSTDAALQNRGTWLYHLGRQGAFGQRLLRDLNTLVRGGSNIAVAANRIDSDSAYFAQIMNAMFDGDPQFGLSPIINSTAGDEIRAANTLYTRIKGAVETINSLGGTLVQAHAAKAMLISQRDDMLTATRTIRATFARGQDATVFKQEYGWVGLGIGLIAFVLQFFLYTVASDTRKAAERQAEEQAKNQEAILRLLDELGSLADGDLTVQATVSEDITGAIADSINFAIEALRDLVLTVNDTALRVDAAARQTQATASHLADASENQTVQIKQATSQISTMAKSIEQVSANADRSTRVAQQSVEIANKGGEAVRRTIDGMNSIRETIQETSKRIKRLGESSQEIGDIVELINDIAEQTNILALNAAIQASMAGEAGRGFAVVADEVQRLAERSANATRQIEALVKTIQTDTNEAVISMEQSTAGVVSGAQLAENAGSALDEIVKVSNHIATLIQSISATARQQATAATDVSRTMNVIQEITTQTSEGTQATARNIGKLATLATELRKSVAGFKLPNMDGGETMVMTAEMHAEQDKIEAPSDNTEWPADEDQAEAEQNA
ncbi:MAG: methyl-accepting chemotaxis protein [Gammaproteobacteria bacterium]|nr:methyl-accepting chemotaxis protein [Gammaproteobacteria bacterium]